jgi:hypothetical protein
MKMSERDLIFQHMKTVREITENAIKQIPEEAADIIPAGFNNHIRWNFGHIAYIQEKLVYGLLGEKMNVPEEYEQLFARGTKPSEWTITPPTLHDIAIVLCDQKTRIPKFLEDRLNEKLPTPFTNSGGNTFYTVGETFLFSLYHEAIHMNVIKQMYRQIKKMRAF